MELTLPGFAVYNIDGWDGKVEVEALRKYQYGRIAGAYSEVALYRKLLKVFSAPDSPVTLPKGLAPKDLDFAHFLQLLTAVVACHERYISEIIKCPSCSAKNPKSIDIIKATTITPPKNPVAMVEIQYEGETIQCKRMTIGTYLELQNYINTLYTGKPEEIRLRIKEEYGSAFPLVDDEDYIDLRDSLDDVGAITILTEYKGKTFKELFIWLSQLQGKEQTELYDKIDTAIADMASTLSATFKDNCVVCNEPLEKEISPVGYFFDTRQL